ncbi:MAG: NAD(P)-dependent oxidoreductase [Betaproteobacteria bacterium]|nr:NAD(P)-dependent oxidoreductase [Betaproteobacteria bacterium]
MAAAERICGVVGAGLMGSAVCARLRGAGFDVSVFDVDTAKAAALASIGARPVDSIAALASCPAVVLAVFNTDQVEAVVEGPGGLLDGIVAGSASPVVICTSTCDPDRLEALDRRQAPRGLRLLEVPVSGTSRQVAAGSGVGLVGGDRATMAAVAPVLDAICPERHYLGAVGNGSRAKLAVHLVLGLNRAAMAEGLVFAERLGLEREAFLAVARGSAAYSAVMETKGPLMARRQFSDPQSRVDQSLKDFHLMIEQAAARGQPLPFAEVYARMLESCMALGEGAQDNALIVEAIARCRRTG